MRVSLFIQALQSELFNGSIKSVPGSKNWDLYSLINKKSLTFAPTYSCFFFFFFGHHNLLASLSDICAPNLTFRLSSV